MRNVQREAAIWDLFTSIDFLKGAARECENITEWFGQLATSRHVADFGRNNQIYDIFKQRASDFRRGADLASLGDYRLIWNIASSINGDVRGILEQSLHSWMTEAEHNEFSTIRLSRVIVYAGNIKSALHNGLVGTEYFYNPNPNCPERSDDDDGFPGDDIVRWYEDGVNSYGKPSMWNLPDPLPEYVVDKSISCGTGDEVPWTGVWYPSMGLEQHSLTFAIKGNRMQPVYRVIKSIKELQRENPGVILSAPQTVAVPTIWHPLIQNHKPTDRGADLWAKAGEPCPKAGRWQPTDPGAAQRNFEAGDTMANLGSAYGLTVWRWVADR